jgi:hypothetical protein
MVMLAEIGGINGFGAARKLGAWAGLSPTVRSSDLTVRHGHISKQGSTWLRWSTTPASGSFVLGSASGRSSLTPSHAMATHPAHHEEAHNNQPKPPATDSHHRGSRPHASLTHPAYMGAETRLRRGSGVQGNRR